MRPTLRTVWSKCFVMRSRKSLGVPVKIWLIWSIVPVCILVDIRFSKKFQCTFSSDQRQFVVVFHQYSSPLAVVKCTSLVGCSIEER